MAEAAERETASPLLRIYEFVPSDPKDGVTVTEHTFDPLEGFDIEQFSAVAEEIYERSIEIYNPPGSIRSSRRLSGFDVVPEPASFCQRLNPCGFNEAL